jgi:hypothetical protein
VFCYVLNVFNVVVADIAVVVIVAVVVVYAIQLNKRPLKKSAIIFHISANCPFESEHKRA